MGEAFGNYEILRRIAAGGMAEVFLAKARGAGGFERLVCIKRILPQLGGRPELVSMFFDEARIAANLLHPNIAQVYEIGEVDGAYYIAMEYVRGEDLRHVYNQEVARGRTLPPDAAAQIALGAAHGLDHAHRQTSIDGRPLGIVHRDVSPQNVLVTYDGFVKVVDFGIAKAAGKLTETRAGALKGKYSYMSPEQAAGDPVDARTDVFALGITLYEVTTGQRLFKRDSEIETLQAVIDCQVPPPSDRIRGYDPDLEAVILRALAHDAGARYQTAAEMARALELLLHGRRRPAGAQSLGAYMRDLFAEKLAEELRPGGAPAYPDATPALAGAGRARDASLEPTVAMERPRYGDTAAGEPVRRSGPRAASPDRLAHAIGPAHRGGGARESPAAHGPPGGVPAGAARRAAGATAGDRRPRYGWLLLGIVALLSAAAGLAAALLSDTGRGFAELAVESEPRGARVIFVGPGAEDLNARYDARGFRTPFRVRAGIPIGAGLRARFVKEGYDVAEREVPPFTEGGALATVFAELAPVEDDATLSVTTTPPGAAVTLDGAALKGKTPLEGVRVRSGTLHRIEIRLRGYQIHRESSYVERGARRAVDVKLVPERPR